MNKIKFSFIIPVYNQEKLIKKCLESIPYDYAHEILICDDKSTDNTLSVVHDWVEKHSKAKLYTNEINQGCWRTYNRLLDLVTGDYVIIIDSDDYLLPKMRRVLAMVDGSKDIYYYNMITNENEVYKKNKENRYSLCGEFKISRYDFIKGIHFRNVAGGDYFFNKAIMDKNPTEFYTNLVAYHYNFPRKDSVTELTLNQSALTLENTMKWCIVVGGREHARTVELCTYIKEYSTKIGVYVMQNYPEEPNLPKCMFDYYELLDKMNKAELLNYVSEKFAGRRGVVIYADDSTIEAANEAIEHLIFS